MRAVRVPWSPYEQPVHLGQAVAILGAGWAGAAQVGIGGQPIPAAYPRVRPATPPAVLVHRRRRWSWVWPWLVVVSATGCEIWAEHVGVATRPLRAVLCLIVAGVATVLTLRARAGRSRYHGKGT